MSFTLLGEEGKARLGVLETRHGKVHSPFFMPIATKGAAKHITFEELEQAGSEAIIANAFVLYLKPGLELLEKAGGAHKFMNWGKVMFTDSGGFQILSEKFLHKLSDKGVYFKNPYGGKIEFFSPEQVMDIEMQIGSDVAMALDDVPHYGTSREYIEQSLKRTHDWAKRCKEAHTDDKQLLFGICQGGTFLDLREKSAKFMNDLDVDGVALGGLGIGEGSELMNNMLDVSMKHIAKEKPRYLMGVGSPRDIVEAVARGVDCFDSRFPTQNARRGMLFTSQGNLRIEQKGYKEDFSIIDEGCTCQMCKNHTKAYIHHLFKTKEPNRERQASVHNITFMQKLMREIREAIKENRFESFRKEFLEKYKL